MERGQIPEELTSTNVFYDHDSEVHQENSAFSITNGSNKAGTGLLGKAGFVLGTMVAMVAGGSYYN